MRSDDRIWPIRGAPRRWLKLPDINLEQGVGMFMAPAPVRLLVVSIELGEIAIFAMVLFRIHAIRLIFMRVPFMIVVMLFVVVAASGCVIGS